MRARRRGCRRGQTLVEFAVVSPLLFFIVFALIDVGRLVYIYNSISSASREGARLVALTPQLYSDCDPLTRMKAVAQTFTMAQDPNSVANSNNVDPNYVDPNTGKMPPGEGPTTPAAGQANMYIYPAVATSVSATACPAASSTQRKCPPNLYINGTQTGINAVAVEIQYSFQPLTPVISTLFPSVVVRSISETPPDYC